MKEIPWWDIVATKMRISVYAGQGYFNVYSPKRSIHGFRKYFGWHVLMLGAYIMFGRRKEWMTYTNCEMEKW